MTVGYLERLVSSADVVFLDDSIGDSGFGMLRTLPAVTYLGVDHFTFPKSWRQLGSSEQYDHLDYEYLVLGQDELAGADLCAITNQNFELHTEYTLAPVINRYRQGDHTLFIIADRRDFDPQGGQRPLYMQPFVEYLGSYTDVYDRFVEYYSEWGYDCPLTDTRNLFMHDNANLYEIVEGEPIERVETLFEVVADAPYLPLYDAFSAMFSRDLEPGSAPLESQDEIEGLGRWLRRRVEWDRHTGLSVARELNRTVSEDERVFDHVQQFRHPSIGTARQEAVSLDPEDNPIDRRYHAWLTEGPA
jgi:hypothetical protein